MHAIDDIGLEDVTAVYAGSQGDLWELVMGQQIHIGGLKSSAELAERAGIGAGMRGVDLCCCNGAGMRFLTRLRGVDAMIGVDASDRVVARGRRRTAEEGLEERVRFVHADACASGLPDASANFVWGEDAWCYVADKARLVHEAARIVRPGGVIAFTDWVEGPAGLSATEADRLLRFMKFPSLQDIPGYAGLLAGAGCEVITAEDTGRFAPCMDLYHAMVDMQLGWDAMRIVGFDLATMGAIAGEMQFVRELGHAGKLAQGRFVARAGDRGTT